MKHHERMAMTPLEIAVWAAKYVQGGPTYPIEHADQAVEMLRERLEAAQQAELHADAQSLHTVVLVQSTGVATYNTLRCSCGYRPYGREWHDVEELMAAHLAHVRARDPGETR